MGMEALGHRKWRGGGRLDEAAAAERAGGGVWLARKGGGGGGSIATVKRGGQGRGAALSFNFTSKLAFRIDINVHHWHVK